VWNRNKVFFSHRKKKNNFAKYRVLVLDSFAVSRKDLYVIIQDLTNLIKQVFIVIKKNQYVPRLKQTNIFVC
jgi:hypothetical protein